MTNTKKAAWDLVTTRTHQEEHGAVTSRVGVVQFRFCLERFNGSALWTPLCSLYPIALGAALHRTVARAGSTTAYLPRLVEATDTGTLELFKGAVRYCSTGE